MPRAEIFHKFKEGKLYSGSGHKVRKRSQAVAIAMQYKSCIPFTEEDACRGYQVIG